MSRQHAINLNNNLAELLDGMFSQCQVPPENPDIIVGNPANARNSPPYGAIQNGELEKRKQRAWGYNSARSDNPIFVSSGLKDRPQRHRLGSSQ